MKPAVREVKWNKLNSGKLRSTAKEKQQPALHVTAALTEMQIWLVISGTFLRFVLFTDKNNTQKISIFLFFIFFLHHFSLYM